MLSKSLLYLSAIALINSCHKGQQDADRTTLATLYATYSNGEIGECQYKGSRVYTAGLNAYDAGTLIYDLQGNIIARCNYGWGPVDTICKQLGSCETVYRCANHISGEPFVDKYGLTK